MDFYSFVINNYYFLLAIVFAFFFVFLYLSRKKLNFPKVSKKTLFILIAIFIVALALRLFYIDHIHQHFNDEYSYKEVSNTLYSQQTFCECLDPQAGVCDDCIPPIWAPGWSFVLSFTYLFNPGYNALFFVNSVLGALSIFLMFIFVYIVSKKESLALIASLLLAVIPVHLKFSGSMTSEISSLFFILLLFIFSYLYIKKNSFNLLALTAITLIIVVQFRFEAVFFIPLTLWFIYLYDKNFKKTWKLITKNKKAKSLSIIILLLGVVCASFYLPHIVYTFNANNFNGITSSDSQTLTFFQDNVPRNLKFFFEDLINPLFVTILSLIGAWSLFKKNKPLAWFSSGFFLLFFFVYSLHGMGHFNIGWAERYTIIFFIPVALFFSYGFDFLLSIIKNKRAQLFFLIVLIIFLLYLPFKFSSYMFTLDSLQEEFLVLSDLDVDNDCTIFANQHYFRFILNYDVYPISFIPDIDSDCKILYSYDVILDNDFNPSDLYPYLELVPLENFKSDNEVNPFFRIIE